MDGRTRVHLDAEDFTRYLDERAAIRTLSLALGCEDSSASVLKAVKRLMEHAEVLEKANKAFGGCA